MKNSVVSESGDDLLFSGKLKNIKCARGIVAILEEYALWRRVEGKIFIVFGEPLPNCRRNATFVFADFVRSSLMSEFPEREADFCVPRRNARAKTSVIPLFVFHRLACS